MSNEGSFPMPHVSTWTLSNGRMPHWMLLESRIDYEWNVDGGRETIGATDPFAAVLSVELKSSETGTRGPGSG